MKLPIAIIVLAYSCSVSAQGTFQNLDFEQAAPVFVGQSPGYTVTAASALPYWTATIGGVQESQIGYNGGSLGAPFVTLLGPSPPTPGLPVIDGNYSVLLTGSFPSEVPAISQNGLIPAGAQTLLFEAQQGGGAGGNGTLAVMIGTQTVAIMPVGTGPNYVLYGANISAWAGQTEELTFSASENPIGLNNWVIDDISFSPTAVPEPNPLVLTGVGGLLFALYRRLALKCP